MRTHSLVLTFVLFGAVAGCGGEVSGSQDNGESRAAATEGDCPHVAPQQGIACTPAMADGARCEYPVDFCSHSYLCKCTADRGWICEMPAECVSR
jgi:hypothetical protein